MVSQRGNDQITRTTWRVAGSVSPCGRGLHGRTMGIAQPIRDQCVRIWRNTLINNSPNMIAVHTLKSCLDNTMTIRQWLAAGTASCRQPGIQINIPVHQVQFSRLGSAALGMEA